MLLIRDITIHDSWLCNFDAETEDVENVFLHFLQEGEFHHILVNPLIGNLLENADNRRNTLVRYLDEMDDPERYLEALGIGIACLFVFVEINWNGIDYGQAVFKFKNEHTLQSNNRNELSMDGDDINENVKYLKCLQIARLIFEVLLDKADCVLVRVWALRSLMIHQLILEDLSSAIYDEAMKVITDFNIEELPTTGDRARYCIEVAHIYLIFGRITEAEVEIKKAKELAGITIEMRGEMGKRTYHQEKSVAQIKLHLTVTERHHRRETPNENLPDVVKLDDDVRLDAIKWDSESEDDPPLSGLEQSVLLAELAFKRKATPTDNLSNEEIFPFIDCILKQTCCWAARVSALALKCKLDATHKRTVERAVAQCESLVNNIKSNSLNHLHRLNNFWNVGPPPIWKLEGQLADLLLSVGLVKSALNYYLNLRLWEDVIVCYTILQLKHKVTEVIEQELAKKPTVKLLCLLGDATDDTDCYERAWELSEKRSARPHRHWGQNLFAKKQYEECIPHLEKSLAINSLQATVWLRLGYAAINVKQWQLAATAYRRYTNIEPNSAEAWNNLARVYLALGDKKRAHKALTEAMKTSFDNWQVWDNLMVVSIDTGHFDDVIRAYHRLLDIQGKHLDCEILTILTRTILNGILDYNGNSTKRLMQPCLELLGRVTAIHPNEYKPWELYARLSTDPVLSTKRFQRAFRAFVQKGDWMKDPEKCGIGLNLALKLGNACIEAKDAALNSTIKLTLRSAHKAASTENWPDHSELLLSLQSVIDQLSNSQI